MSRFPAHFDGKHLCPDTPVALPVGQRLWVTVEVEPSPGQGREAVSDFFGRIESETGLTEGPEDWAAQHDHYLYGTPKRRDGDGK